MEIKKRLRNFQGPEYVSPSYLYKPWAELAELLAKVSEQLVAQQLLQNTAEMSQYFQQRLSSMKFKQPANLGIIGLAIGIKFENDGYASEIATQAQKKGVLISSGRRSFTLFPALNIDKKVAEQGLDILEQCL